MIKIYEQYGFKREHRRFLGLSDNCRTCLSSSSPYKRTVKRKGKEEMCYSIYFDNEDNDYHFQTSYFVGLDWVEENRLSIYVQPKQNKNSVEVNYIRMLLDALQEPENFNHLDDLIHIDFNRPHIRIEQKQDILSPFLIAQFLQIVKKIVQKGLKKSYYPVVENLNARVKGKILVSRNIKENTVKGRNIHTICRYQEFGVNCDENKILKKAYQFSRRVIQQYKEGIDNRPLLQLINYIHPAFEKVSDDVDMNKVKAYKSNPLFKEYDQAIKLAILILKRFSYNINNTEEQKIATPPFWIDMSKLFELYVFKKLKEVYTGKDEVIYHYTVNSKELDFLINAPQREVQIVVDAKYKPRYETESIDLNDYRQLSGYARLKRVYTKLGKNEKENIDCLIIYPVIGKEQKIVMEAKKESSEYVKFYRLGIGIPVL